MQPTILLSGRLTRKRLENARREIERYRVLNRGDPIALVIASEGGVVSATLEFIEYIEKNGVRVSAKIYQAESAAALIAMVASEREMLNTGIFSIHLGSITVETSEVTEGRICGKVLAEATRLRTQTFNLMRKCGFPEKGNVIDKLLARNRLTLSAEECLKLGIIKRVI